MEGVTGPPMDMTRPLAPERDCRAFCGERGPMRQATESEARALTPVDQYI